MNAKIDKAIELLAAQITETVESNDAIRYTQAALNLAHVLATLDCLKKDNGRAV